jgi:RNA polymerase sigma factor (sigma-70 family)
MNHRATEFARVYQEHVWRVYGFLAYHLREAGLAEDLTQTTFERALRAWSRFDPRRGSETTWLMAIARNALIDHHRRRRHERRDPDDPRDARAAAPATVPGPEQRLDGSSELPAALAELSDREREVVALRYGGDLSGPEIASLLGLSLANVQQILSRSLRKLRILLRGQGEARRRSAVG